MNSAMPNSSNPFLPNNISPGLLSAPLENAYLQDGVPQLAAPMMSAVYRPFGMTFFQPNPFQVTPQGAVTLTGMYGEDSNIAYTTNQPSWGSFFSITPAVYYSNFDDYGYISLMGSASYYQYNAGNIPAYIDETAGISAGTYLGDRVFVGVQDMGFVGFSPGMNGSPLAFFTGINPYYGNMSDAEVGFALTPKVTFVQSASDMYFDDSGYGAGIYNIQSLMDTLNYKDTLNFVSLSYIYQQGIISLFPGFISDGLMGSAMRMVSPTTSFGVGGTASYFLYDQSQAPTGFFRPHFDPVGTHVLHIFTGVQPQTQARPRIGDVQVDERRLEGLTAIKGNRIPSALEGNGKASRQLMGQDAVIGIHIEIERACGRSKKIGWG